MPTAANGASASRLVAVAAQCLSGEAKQGLSMAVGPSKQRRDDARFGDRGID